MRAECRRFSLKEVGLTRAQLECVYIHLKGYHFPLSTHMSFYWAMNSKGERIIHVEVNKLELTFTVTNTKLLATMEDFQNAFQEEPPLSRAKLMDKLALYDIRREMRWAITAYHQSKISEVSGW